MQHDQREEEAEEDDTLSFSDLPIYSTDDYQWEDEDRSFSSSSFSSSSFSDQDNYFEFFSQDPPTYPVHQNILFCGKIIPFKNPSDSYTSESSQIDEPVKKRWIFRRNSMFFGKSTSNKPKLGCDSSRKSLTVPYSDEHRVSKRGGKVLPPSPAKSRWPDLLMFGSMKMPEEMDLTKTKSGKQRRRNPAVSSREDDVRSGKVLWGLVKALACGSPTNNHQFRHPSPVMRD